MDQATKFSIDHLDAISNQFETVVLEIARSVDQEQSTLWLNELRAGIGRNLLGVLVRAGDVFDGRWKSIGIEREMHDETPVERALTFLSQTVEQIRIDSVKIVESDENDKWTKVKALVETVNDLLSIKGKSKMKNTSMVREIMVKVVNRIILETTAKNNDLTLIGDNLVWIKQFHGNCSKLEHLYNSALTQKLNQIETKCHGCAINLAQLDETVTNVTEIANMIQNFREYCDNHANTDNVVNRGINDVINTLSDRITNLIYQTLNINPEFEEKHGIVDNINALSKLQGLYRNLTNSQSWRDICNMLEPGATKTMTTAAIFEECESTVKVAAGEQAKDQGNDEHDDEKQEEKGNSVDPEENKTGEPNIDLETLNPCVEVFKEEIFAIEKRLRQEYGIDEKRLILMRNDELVIVREINQCEKQLNECIIEQYFNKDKLRHEHLVSIKTIDLLFKFVDKCINNCEKSNVVLIPKSKTWLIYDFVKYYAQYQCEQIDDAIKYFMTQTRDLTPQQANVDSIDLKEDGSDNNTPILRTPTTEANVISALFKQIVTITTAYPKIASFVFVDCSIANLIAKWKEQMKQISSNLEQLLDNKDISLHQCDNFSDMLAIIVALQKTEECGIVDSKCFTKLYNITKSVTEEDYQRLIQYIANKDIGAIGKYMNALDVKQMPAKQYESFSHLLGEMILDCANKLSSVLRQLPFRMTQYETFINKYEFDKLIDNLNDIKSCRLVKHLSQRKLRSWNKFLQRMVAAIKRWQSNMVELIKKNLNSMILARAHSRIETLKQIWDRTNGSCLEIEKQNKISSRINNCLEKQFRKLKNTYLGLCQYEQHRLANKKNKLVFYNKQIERSIQFCQIHSKSRDYCKLYQQLCQNMESEFISNFKNVLKSIESVKKHYYEHCSKMEFVNVLVDSVLVSELKLDLEKESKYKEICKLFLDNKNKEDELLMDTINKFNFEKDFSENFVKLCFIYRARKEYKDECVANKIFDVMSDTMENKVQTIYNFVNNDLTKEPKLHLLSITMKQVTNLSKIQNKTPQEMIRINFGEIRETINNWALQQSADILQQLSNSIEYDTPILSSVTVINSICNQIENLSNLILLHDTNKISSPFIDKKFKTKFIVRFLNDVHDYFHQLLTKFELVVEELHYDGLEIYFKYIESYTFKLLRKVLNEAKLFIVNKKTIAEVKYSDDNVLNVDKMTEVIMAALSKIQTKMIKRKILDTTKNFPSTNARLQFYENIGYTLEQIRGSSKLSKYMKIDTIDKFYRPCLKKISNEIQDATYAIAEIFTQERISEESFKKINNLFSSLQAMVTVDLTANSTENAKLDLNIESIKQKIICCLVAMGDECTKSDEDIIKVAKLLIQLQMASHHLLDAQLKEVTKTTIVNNLEKYKKKHGILELGKILTHGKQLDENEIIWGKEIVSSQNIFSGAKIQLWNEKMSGDMRFIDEVLRRTFIHLPTKDYGNTFAATLKKQYLVFESVYCNLRDKCINYWDVEKTAQMNLCALSNEAKELANEIIHENPNILEKVSEDFSRKTAELIAYIFTIWTLQDSKYYFENKDTVAMDDSNTYESKLESKNSNDCDASDPKYYLKQPKITQVIAIMILLNIDQEERTRLVSNLVQIGTGEGKSLVLAVLGCVFALFGYNVYCVSYGKLLAQRDYAAFWDLFSHLQVLSKIEYGTFRDLCRELIGQQVNGRQVADTILGKNKNPEYYKLSESKKNTILLVDEVDVFFDAKYFGQTSNYARRLRDPCISKLTDLIWTKTKSSESTGPNSLIFDEIKQTPEYAECEKLFGFFMPLIDGKLKRMVSAAYDVLHGSHEYVVFNQKIGYKVNDYIRTSRSGNHTTFAYYFEFEKENVSEQNWIDAKSFSITCGKFSYAEIPSCFNNIIVGVTGTLRTLSKDESTILEDIYNIKKCSYMPSIFKESKLTFNESKHVMIYKNEEFHEQLYNSIDEARKQSLKERCRPVLVFFKDDKTLKKFYNSKEFSGLKNETLILNEELTHDEKMKLIKDACRLNAITLATRIFGRGTDFQIIDERVNKIGGTHVIQTFFSVDISEEAQIKGRTARHGDHGSFSMVLNFEDVCKDFDIIDDDKKAMEGASNVYTYLLQKREAKMKNKNSITMKKLENAKKEHDKSYKLCQMLRENNNDEVLKILLALN